METDLRKTAQKTLANQKTADLALVCLTQGVSYCPMGQWQLKAVEKRDSFLIPATSDL
jgi:hypothetical protein